MSNPGQPTGDSAMGPPAFQSATSFLKSTETLAGPGAPSFRNASGGLPQVRDSEDSNSDTQPQGGPSAPPVQPQAGSSRPINRPASSKSSIVYNSVQRRNPVLGAIRSVGIEIGDIPADYQVGAHNGVLFLRQCSLKYHRLHPEYIHQRIEKMKNMYNLRIILVLCDVNEHHQSLRELSKIAIINDFTVFVAWSNEEIAQYLVTFKQFEHKSADMLKERVQQTYHDQLQHVLTSGKKVNKTDANNLAAEFGSLDNMSRKSAKALSNVKGLGATKVTSLVDAFNKPFLVGGLKRPEKTTSPRGQQGSEESIYVGSSPDPSVAQDGVNGADGEMDGAAVWRDPLDDDDEVEVPSPKRTRVDDV
ncbi:hypothetical protein I350_05371 [Cryptococcus amylolentus CBS 6273]|uniref:ERCC1-like central domain-containing protein n=1 Tax=Cryptococcus amylolentus CBS 6273 TaxID=1296118 RepID=A0A1E3JVA1_9TREE|nr:hypothetical protein I350_05371 [Cryptococcus amylolentus CBS 6273]